MRGDRVSDERTQLIAQFRVGWHEFNRWQHPLMVQLGAHMTAIQSKGNEPGGGGKPKTKPPVDLSVMDLYYDCLIEVRAVEKDKSRELDSLNSLRLKARRLLGYDAPMMSLPSVVCHSCGGPLEVASDASSSVLCVERCGIEYPTSTWLDILAAQGSDTHEGK